VQKASNENVKLFVLLVCFFDMVSYDMVL
jgi:hypothetical protein